MNIRQAILQAADQIGRAPDLFNFNTCVQPSLCGTPGCALGWIGFFAGVKCKSNIPEDYLIDVMDGTGIVDATFYQRMNTLCGISENWMRDAACCAKNMRLYADEYHPESRSLIPANVRAIFTMTPEQIRAEFQRENAQSFAGETPCTSPTTESTCWPSSRS